MPGYEAPSDLSIESVPETIVPSPSSSGRNRFYFRTVAELGRQAAEALHHAHEYDVLHRDIKPANLMVDQGGHLCITDFGLARIADDVGMTRTGDLLGTLRYMSPEQALGRIIIIDERSDIYSLGVTLYELATLHPAFDASDRQVLLQQVARSEPISPTRLDRSIPRDLETIILKAMAKEPTARYHSTQAFADDLLRFLDDKPILARRPGPIEQVVKWSRRHRPVVATALAAILFGLPIATTLIWLEKGQTEHALDDAKMTRAREKELLRLTFVMSDEMTMRAMQTVASLGNTNGEQSEFYLKALSFYEKIAEKMKHDPEMRAITTQALHRVGFARMILHCGATWVAYKESIDLFEQLHRERPDDFDILDQLVAVLKDQNYGIRASRGLDAALPIYERTIKFQNTAAKQYPFQSRLLIGLTMTQLEWATILDGESRAEDALKLRQKIIADYAQLVAKLSAGAKARRELAGTHLRKAIDSLSLGQRNEAELLHRLGLMIDPDDCYLLNSLAWMLVQDPAHPPYDPKQALALVDKALQSEDKTPWEFAHTRGVILFRLGRWDETIEALRLSMKLRKGGDPNEWFFLAMAEFHRGYEDEARVWYDRSLVWLEQLKHRDPDLDRYKAETEALLGIKPVTSTTRTRGLGGSLGAWRTIRSWPTAWPRV